MRGQGTDTTRYHRRQRPSSLSSDATPRRIMSSPTTLDRKDLEGATARQAAGPHRGRVSAAGKPAPSRVLFVGPIKTEAPCGSTVKNELMVRGLVDRGVKVDVVDTGDSGRNGRLRQLGQLLGSRVSHRQLVVSASRNGVYTLVPLFGALTLLGYRFAILVTGSGLPRHVNRLKGLKHRYFKWSVTRASAIFAEGDWISHELEKVGVQNSHYLPNPRPRPVTRWNPATLGSGEMAFISRVTAEQGVEDAMAAVERRRAGG